MSEIIVSTRLTTITCPKCAGLYAIAQSYLDEAQKLGGFKQCWTCPYCKAERGYGVGEADRLRKELAEVERRREDWKREAERQTALRRAAEEEREHFRKSRDGLRGAMVRERNRIAKGVCPCCRRSFVDLRRHMESKHPGFAGGAKEGAEVGR